MMAQEMYLRVVAILNAHDVPYMLVGSLSTNFHSIIRATKDADIVIQSSLRETAAIIARDCPALHVDPQLGFENVTATTKIELRTASNDFAIELFGLSDDPHDQLRFQRRTRVDWLGEPTWIASLEDALITKLRWALTPGREKDVVDARNVIAIQQDAIDWPYVEQWCDQHRSRQLLEKLRGEVRGR
ncbi:MAG: hypothetical protein K8T25_04260 [Planctomycetia bacterium]|nr:hypothetical protein [Planctomycetia bacterium]